MLLDSPFLTSGDICEIADMAQSTLDRWVASGVIRVYRGGRMTGDHRKYTVMQAVAIAYGLRLRRAGCCVLSQVRRVFDGVSTLPEEELLKAFEEGRTYLMPMEPLPLVGRWMGADEVYDLEAAYLETRQRIAEIQQRLRNKGGRLRGLASV